MHGCSTALLSLPGLRCQRYPGSRFRFARYYPNNDGDHPGVGSGILLQASFRANPEREMPSEKEVVSNWMK